MNLKEKIQKFRPDKQKVDLGNENIIGYKISKNKIVLEFNKEFDDEVDINVAVGVTGDVFNIKKGVGVDCTFVATKRF